MGCINGFMPIKNEDGICQCEKIDGVVDDGAINPELWAIMERAQMDKISLWKNGSHRSFKRYYCAPWKGSDDLCCVARPGTERGWDVDEVTFDL